jgi:hypothetical protein
LLITNIIDGTNGGSFILTAKPNAVNYVGSSTAALSYNYVQPETDITSMIPKGSMMASLVDHDL